MADGCNLYTTENDLKQIENSINSGFENNGKNSARDYLKNFSINEAIFMKALSNTRSIEYKIINSALREAFRGDLTDEDQNNLPEALFTVINAMPNTPGLFQSISKPRGYKSSRMQHAGELVITAGLIQKGKIETSLSNSLIIDKNNLQIVFGQKFPSNFISSVNTIEADILLYLKHDDIGIDAKYSKSSTHYGIKNEYSFNKQLEGIRNCFSDGSLKQYLFVSNVKFSIPFIEKINNYNLLIFQDVLSNDIDKMNEIELYCKDEVNGSLLSASIGVLSSIFEPTKLNSVAQKYNIPQIDYCENIAFNK